jgi:hypothetical protein
LFEFDLDFVVLKPSQGAYRTSDIMPSFRARRFAATALLPSISNFAGQAHRLEPVPASLAQFGQDAVSRQNASLKNYRVLNISKLKLHNVYNVYNVFSFK